MKFWSNQCSATKSKADVLSRLEDVGWDVRQRQGHRQKGERGRMTSSILTHGVESRLMLLACVDDADLWFEEKTGRLGEAWITWSTRWPTEDGRSRVPSCTNSEFLIRTHKDTSYLRTWGATWNISVVYHDISQKLNPNHAHVHLLCAVVFTLNKKKTQCPGSKAKLKWGNTHFAIFHTVMLQCYWALVIFYLFLLANPRYNSILSPFSQWISFY